MSNLQQLAWACDKLSGRDRTFAESLLSQGLKRPLSEKQNYWVGELIKRASGPAATTVLADSQTVTGIIELINRNNNAKYPAVRFLAGPKEMKLSRAGKQARFPGSLNVVAINPHTKERIWYGRIHLDGRYESSSKAQVDQMAIVEALKTFVKDPAEAAREYGRKTGHCCFCGLLLDDERSLLMGYGPVCAKNYELPWGDRPAEETEECPHDEREHGICLDCNHEEDPGAAIDRAMDVWEGER